MLGNTVCTILCTVLLSLGTADAQSLGQTQPVTLDISMENGTLYFVDVGDPSKLATSPGPISPSITPQFSHYFFIADVTAVNRQAAKGTVSSFGDNVVLRPNPGPGQAIADTNRTGLFLISAEIMQVDGTPIGTIIYASPNGGPPPPGSPAAALNGNFVVIGGTGAFIGVRGYAVVTALAGIRYASAVEDPANRRLNAVPGVFHVLFVLYPMMRPEVISTTTGPSIFHSDFSLVTAEKPARAGEALIASVRGLGPTNPGLDPGQPFPAYQEGKSYEVNSPLELTVNGKTAAVQNKIGWPGMYDVYRLDFAVPGGTTPGAASVQITAAWISSPVVYIPVQ